MVWWMVLSENIQVHLIAGPVVTEKVQGFIWAKGDNGAIYFFFFKEMHLALAFHTETWCWKARCWDENV